jgi:4'-phosphopantetheinyl transferase EntD
MEHALPRIEFDFPGLPRGISGRVSVCLVSVLCASDEEWIRNHYIHDDDTRSLATRIRHPRRLSESVLARVAKAELLRRFGVDPAIVNFSFSHTRNEHVLVAAAAMSKESVGLDLELLDRLDGRERLQDRLLVGQELERLRESSPSQRALSALKLWCAKESLAKAMGTGLQAPLEQYEAQLRSGPDSCLEAEFLRFPQWYSTIMVHRETVLSICLPRETPS